MLDAYISTVIDFIGGLGVNGVWLSQRRLQGLAVLLVGSSILLCSNIRYDLLWMGLWHRDPAYLAPALPKHVINYIIPLGVLLVTFMYGQALPWLYSLPEKNGGEASFLLV
jgi:hypothetical protein